MSADRSAGELSYAEMKAACKNVGVNLDCDACAAVFYTGSSKTETHTCAEDGANLLAALAGLNLLRDVCHKNAVDHGFHDPEVRPSVGESIALMHSELSEALEDHRDGHAPTEMWYLTANKQRIETSTYLVQDQDESNERLAKPCGIGSEIADVVIRAFDFCGLHSIDLERAVREKMAYNKGRPHRHGGKKL